MSFYLRVILSFNPFTTTDSGGSGVLYTHCVCTLHKLYNCLIVFCDPGVCLFPLAWAPSPCFLASAVPPAGPGPTWQVLLDDRVGEQQTSICWSPLARKNLEATCKMSVMVSDLTFSGSCSQGRSISFSGRLVRHQGSKRPLMSH